MVYEILIANEKIWLKDLSKINAKDLSFIFEKIESLGKNPFSEQLQVKKLKNYALADFRLRVGSYRILLNRNIEKREIILYRVLHRSKLYLSEGR